MDANDRAKETADILLRFIAGVGADPGETRLDEKFLRSCVKVGQIRATVEGVFRQAIDEAVAEAVEPHKDELSDIDDLMAHRPALAMIHGRHDKILKCIQVAKTVDDFKDQAEKIVNLKTALARFAEIGRRMVRDADEQEVDVRWYGPDEKLSAGTPSTVTLHAADFKLAAKALGH